MAFIKIDGMADAVEKILKEYGEETMADIDTATKKTAQEVAKQIKANARAVYKKGKYASSWTVKKNPNLLRMQRGYVVCAGKNGYYLTHLLEFGHAKVNGGRVEGREHIAPAADAAPDLLIENIKKEMER